MKHKEPVKLREKQLESGIKSLYLDIYLDGRRKYEFLKLYLVPEISREAKAENKRVTALANAIKAKRVIEIQNNRFDFSTDRNNANFIEYVRTKIDESKNGERTKMTYERMYELAKIHFGDTLKFKHLSSLDEVQSFYDFLIDHYGSPNTANLTFSKFVKFANLAVKEGLIATTAVARIERKKSIQHERKYLTIEEVRKLSETMGNDNVRRSFIFSCLTGLRFSDLRQLRWEMITTSGERMRITFSQKKTNGLQYLDINSEAKAIIESIEKRGGLVFPELTYGAKINYHISKWVDMAGINKHISFHCGRHTFAVMMVELGVDLYTISKLLGHESITTTQIYAKMVDKRKREAVDLIPKIF